MSHFFRYSRRRLLLFALALFSLSISVFSLGPTVSAHVDPDRRAGCAQPPAGQDPTTFTAQQLRYYGLPVYVKGMNRVAWEQTVRSAKHHVCTSTRTNKIHRQPGRQQSKKGDAYFYNWSGYESNGDGGYTFAYSSWQVPCITAGSPTGDSLVWVGLGGDGNNNLVQTGTEQTVSYDAYNNPTYSYSAWVENLAYDTNPYINTVFNVSCGDYVGAYIFSDGTMFINDVTSSTYTTQKYGPAANTGTAEFIVERTEIGDNVYTSLDDFGSVTMTLNYVETTAGTSVYLADTQHQRLIMVGDDGMTVLDSVGAIDTSNYNAFTVTWLRSNS